MVSSRTGLVMHGNENQDIWKYQHRLLDHSELSHPKTCLSWILCRRLLPRHRLLRPAPILRCFGQRGACTISSDSPPSNRSPCDRRRRALRRRLRRHEPQLRLSRLDGLSCIDASRAQDVATPGSVLRWRGQALCRHRPSNCAPFHCKGAAWLGTSCVLDEDCQHWILLRRSRIACRTASLEPIAPQLIPAQAGTASTASAAIPNAPVSAKRAISPSQRARAPRSSALRFLRTRHASPTPRFAADPATALHAIPAPIPTNRSCAFRAIARAASRRAPASATERAPAAESPRRIALLTSARARRVEEAAIRILGCAKGYHCSQGGCVLGEAAADAGAPVAQAQDAGSAKVAAAGGCGCGSAGPSPALWIATLAIGALACRRRNS